jgi:hypothetical protein
MESLVLLGTGLSLRQAGSPPQTATAEAAVAPPEPAREPSSAGKRSWFRSRAAVILYVVTGALLVGGVARGGLDEDS